MEGVPNDGATSGNRQWKLTQTVLASEEDSTGEHPLTCLAFDESGEFMATGNTAGQVFVFQAHRSQKKSGKVKLSYTTIFSEVECHTPDFDVLNSKEISEEVTSVHFCPSQNNALFLLTSSARTIKLWKLGQREVSYFDDPPCVHRTLRSFSDLRLPRATHQESKDNTVCKRSFTHAHNYDIQSVSLSSDGLSFISADFLRIHLWDVNVGHKCFNIVDIKNPFELRELITSAQFSPSDSNTFVYSTSQGGLSICDMRHHAKCDPPSLRMGVGAHEPFAAEKYISDAKFMQGGGMVYARDFNTIKVWDLRLPSEPVDTVSLFPETADLQHWHYGRFTCAANCHGSTFVSGLFNENFAIGDPTKSTETVVLGKHGRKPHKKAKPSPYGSGSIVPSTPAILSCFHPTDNLFAISSQDALYIYEEQSVKSKDKTST